MFKNQLQELAQRSCFNLPSYQCIREGPDHAPRFKSTVTFNGESFESPGFCNTLRQAEHAAAEVALNALSVRGPAQSLAARILDETGFCKNLLQETAQRAGVNIPVYSVTRSGPGHIPVFVSTVEVAGMSFGGESAKTKKQAEKNAAMAAWAALKKIVIQNRTSFQLPADSVANEQQLQITIGRVLMKAAQENRTAATPTMQGTPPSVARPIPNPRITITPLEETSDQETGNIRTPAARASLDATANPTGQEKGAGHANRNDKASHDSFRESTSNLEPGSSFTVGRMMTNGTCSVVGRRAPQIHSVIINPGTETQMTFVPINQFDQGDANRFQNGSSTIIITNSDVATPSGSNFPSMHPPYTPVLWTSDNGQYATMVPASSIMQPTNAAFIPTSMAPRVRVRQTAPVCSAPPTFVPTTSMAPRVRVRQTVPVCSAPPRPSEDKEQGVNMAESATQESFAHLKL